MPQRGGAKGKAKAKVATFAWKPVDKAAEAPTPHEKGMMFAQAIVSADAKRASDAKLEDEKRARVIAEVEARRAAPAEEAARGAQATAGEAAPQVAPKVDIVTGPGVVVFGPPEFEAGAAYPLPKREAAAAEQPLAVGVCFGPKVLEAGAAHALPKREAAVAEKLAAVGVHFGPKLLEASEAQLVVASAWRAKAEAERAVRAEVQDKLSVKWPGATPSWRLCEVAEGRSVSSHPLGEDALCRVMYPALALAEAVKRREWEAAEAKARLWAKREAAANAKAEAEERAKEEAEARVLEFEQAQREMRESQGDLEALVQEANVKAETSLRESRTRQSATKPPETGCAACMGSCIIS